MEKTAKTEASGYSLMPLFVASLAFAVTGIAQLTLTSKEQFLAYAAAMVVALYFATKSMALAFASVAIALNTAYFLERKEYLSNIPDLIILSNIIIAIVIVAGLKMVDKKDHKSLAVVGLSLMIFNAIVAMLPAYI